VRREPRNAPAGGGEKKNCALFFVFDLHPSLQLPHSHLFLNLSSTSSFSFSFSHTGRTDAVQRATQDWWAVKAVEEEIEMMMGGPGWSAS